MTSAGSVIVAGARTPFCKLGDAFEDGAAASRWSGDRSGPGL